ncbi:MAG: TfuA-like protein [Egibacteraceae bacterium]
MNAVIFLGPSLPLAEAQQILPARYLPPARQADLLSVAVNFRPDVIGLIDGMFMQALSVWHKEILYALEQGIRVYGASSMGALRAAETAPMGMVGVGEIYRMYATGELLDDDEVALAHGPAESGYQRLSEPMVNVRATLCFAERQGVIDHNQCALLTRIAKQIHFSERTFAEVLRRAADAGMHPDGLTKLAAFLRTGYVDLKANDAIALLETIRDQPVEPTPDGPTLARTSQFDTLYNRDRLVSHDGVEVPLEAIVYHAALFDPDYQDLNFHAQNRMLVAMMARLLDVAVGAEDIEAETGRFRERHELLDDDAFQSWLDRNDLTATEFAALMAEVALCRRLQQWLLMARWMDRNTKTLLDELRLRDRYTDRARLAAAQERLLRETGVESIEVEQWRLSLQELFAEHLEWSDIRPGSDISRWCEEAGFHTEGNLKMELLRARMARRSLLRLLAEMVGDEEFLTE